MKKIYSFILPVILIAYMLTSLSFSANRNAILLCNDLQIIMDDTINSGFLTKANIESLILSEEKDLLGYPISKINTRILEERIRNSPYIKSAEMFYDLEGILYVNVAQRVPVVKVLTKNGTSYYMDSEGFLFSPTGTFTPHILIANGYFTEGSELRKSKDIINLEEKDKYSEWTDLLELVNFIEKDKFWKSQVVQIYYNRNQEFELIPRVGAHQIIFGNADGMKTKFMNLKTLYKEGFAYEGWNKYGIINLKYDNQVICTKR